MQWGSEPAGQGNQNHPSALVDHHHCERCQAPRSFSQGPYSKVIWGHAQRVPQLGLAPQYCFPSPPLWGVSRLEPTNKKWPFFQQAYTTARYAGQSARAEGPRASWAGRPSRNKGAPGQAKVVSSTAAYPPTTCAG